MGKWVPHLVERGAHPLFHTAYVKITRENYVKKHRNSG